MLAYQREGKRRGRSGGWKLLRLDPPDIQAGLHAPASGGIICELGVPQMRVLIVTTAPGRVGNMVEAVKRLTGGKRSNYFLFADQERLRGSSPDRLGKWKGGARPVDRLSKGSSRR
jgi:hypothetical protein